MPDRTSVSVPLSIRPLRESDLDFVREVVPRLIPSQPTPARDPHAFHAWFERFSALALPQHEGAETFVATDVNDVPLGLLTIQPEREYFTDAPRAYIETLVVAESVEGQGVARALMEWAEEWARARGATAIALDVFATNERARSFYRKAGYAEDFVRMVKPLAPDSPPHP